MYKGIADVAAGTAADGIVVHRQAVGVLSAGTWTRVRALVIDARLVLRALGADDATRSAGRRNAGESRLAEADRVTVVNSAMAVGSARRRYAGISRDGQRRHDFQDGAAVHRIAGVARQAGAHRRVIDDTAGCVLAARAGARIDALVVQTGFAAVAIGIGHAFRPAGDIRVAEVLRQARARSDAVSLIAHGVRAARRWIARRARLLRCDGSWK